MYNETEIKSKKLDFKIQYLPKIEGYEGIIRDGIPMSTNAITSSGYGSCNIKVIVRESLYDKIYKNINSDLQNFAMNCGGNKSIYYSTDGYIDIYISGYSYEKNSEVRKFITLIGQKIKRLEYEESLLRV